MWLYGFYSRAPTSMPHQRICVNATSKARYLTPGDHCTLQYAILRNPQSRFFWLTMPPLRHVKRTGSRFFTTPLQADWFPLFITYRHCRALIRTSRIAVVKFHSITPSMKWKASPRSKHSSTQAQILISELTSGVPAPHCVIPFWLPTLRRRLCSWKLGQSSGLRGAMTGSKRDWTAAPSTLLFCTLPLLQTNRWPQVTLRNTKCVNARSYAGFWIPASTSTTNFPRKLRARLVRPMGRLL